MITDNHRFDPHKMHALTDPERQAHWNPAHFLDRLDIRPGAAVLDLGSGPGFWTLPLADRVGPDGIIWALDVSREMLDELARRNPPPQVRTLQSELPKIDLPDASTDWIWAAFVFHEVMPPQKLAEEIFRVTKPSGVAAILDWRPDAVGESGPPRQHRLSINQVTGFLWEAGFGSIQKTWQDDDSYLIEARR